MIDTLFCSVTQKGYDESGLQTTNAQDEEFVSRVDKLQVPLKIKQRQKEEDAVRIEDTEWLVKEFER